jgi:hypothetical protein
LLGVRAGRAPQWTTDNLRGGAACRPCYAGEGMLTEAVMRGYGIGAVLVAGLAFMPSGAPAAGQDAMQLAQAGSKLSPEDELAPSQMAQPMPGAVATPTKNRKPATAAAAVAKPAAAVAKPAAAAPARPAAPTAAANLHAVACSGPFSKDSSSLRLALTFDSRNLTFTDEDIDGSKVGATIIFAKDPKRRLEVWWQNPANRSGTYLILINGRSTWSAPGGMRLGLTLAQLEKLNHKPFNVKGFKDRIASVSDWDGGALASLPGGCKSGVSLQADQKASADAISALPADKDYSSDDASLRELKPTVSEVLIGY